MKLVVDPTAEESKPVNWKRADLRRSILKDCNKEDSGKKPCKNLAGANLQKAILAYADWHEANLSNAKLQEADLTNTNLKGTNLSNAKLQGADLTNTNLKGANLTNANLEGANLTFAQLDEAIVCNTTLPYEKYEWPKDVNKDCN